MSMPFDATLKDLGREGPAEFLTTFDPPPSGGGGGVLRDRFAA